MGCEGITPNGSAFLGDGVLICVLSGVTKSISLVDTFL